MEIGKFRLIGCGGYVCFICCFRGNIVSFKIRKKERKWKLWWVFVSRKNIMDVLVRLDDIKLK